MTGSFGASASAWFVVPCGGFKEPAPSSPDAAAATSHPKLVRSHASFCAWGAATVTDARHATCLPCKRATLVGGAAGGCRQGQPAVHLQQAVRPTRSACLQGHPSLGGAACCAAERRRCRWPGARPVRHSLHTPARCPACSWRWEVGCKPLDSSETNGRDSNWIGRPLDGPTGSGGRGLCVACAPPGINQAAGTGAPLLT